MENYAEEWFYTFQQQRLRPKTVIKEKDILTHHILNMFKDMPIQKITIRSVQNELLIRSQYSRSYLRDIMSMMSQIFSSAVDDCLIDRNPMDSDRIINPSTKAPVERKVLSASEQADIISNLHLLSNENDRRFMAFLMYTCMRPCEIYGLRWEDIDFERQQIHIRRDLTFVSGQGVIGENKTKSSNRMIPLDKNLLLLLSPVSDNGCVICRKGRGHDGEPYTETDAKRSWQRIIKTIDVHGMTPYSGRHTYATNMSKVGIPMKTAISLMGHTDERMLMRHYIHTDEEDLENAGLAMSRFISGIST